MTVIDSQLFQQIEVGSIEFNNYLPTLAGGIIMVGTGSGYHKKSKSRRIYRKFQ